MKSGRSLKCSTGSTAFRSGGVKLVPAIAVRWPPAEKPIMPILSGDTRHRCALARTKIGKMHGQRKRRTFLGFVVPPMFVRLLAYFGVGRSDFSVHHAG